LGLFVLAALAALAVLVVMFGKKPTFLTQRDSYTVAFKNAPGIHAGTPIRRAGVKIGEVAEVILVDDINDADADERVKVRVLLDSKYRVFSNEEPTIAQSLLTGDSTIDLVPRGDGKGREVVSPGTQLKGRSPFDVRGAVSKVEEGLLPTVLKTLEKIQSSLEKVERLAPVAEETLKEYTELSRTAREAIPELRRTNDSIRGIADGAKQMVPEIRKTNEELQAAVVQWRKAGENVNVLLQTNSDKFSKAIDGMNRVFNEKNQTNFEKILQNTAEASGDLKQLSADGSKAFKRFGESMEKADTIMDNLKKITGPFAERSESLAQNFQVSSAQLAITLKDVSELIRVYGRSDGTIQRLLTDPSLFQNANEAVCMLAKLMPRLELTLRNLEVFSDKLARHPELLGVRGLTNPSAGLKDPPFQPAVNPALRPR
jgi:phospholipid/cholesterol/gamma-HCH transport system substrate-binding protein